MKLTSYLIFLLYVCITLFFYFRRQKQLKNDKIIFKISQPKWLKNVFFPILIIGIIVSFFVEDVNPLLFIILIPVFFTIVLIITDKGIFSKSKYIKYNQIDKIEISNLSSKRFWLKIRYANKKGTPRHFISSYENKYKKDICNILKEKVSSINIIGE